MKNKRVVIGILIAVAVLLVVMSVALAAPGDLVLSTTTPTQSGIPGAALVFPLRVANNSSYNTIVTPTFAVSSTWATLPGSFQLAPGTSQIVVVSVAIPDTAITGTAEAFTVTAEGVQWSTTGGSTLLPPSDINSVEFTVNVVSEPVSPTADFVGSPRSGTVPLQVTFTDLSANAPASWTWDFGDGGTSSDQNPVHTYNDPGAYTVTLTVSNTAGSDTEIKQNYITVTAPPPIKIFLPVVLKNF